MLVQRQHLSAGVKLSVNLRAVLKESGKGQLRKVSRLGNPRENLRANNERRKGGADEAQMQSNNIRIVGSLNVAAEQLCSINNITYSLPLFPTQHCFDWT